MALRTQISQAAAGNLAMTLPLYGTSPFTVGTNIQLAHLAAQAPGAATSVDEMIVEVCNIDPSGASHQLVGAIYNPAVGIISPDNVFYQTIPAQSGLTRFLAGNIFPVGTRLALGIPALADASFLNISGFANRIIDPRKLGLTGLTYNGSAWVANPYNLPIKLDGTTPGTARTLYQAVPGTMQYDELYLDFTNTSLSSVLVTLCIGGITGAYFTQFTLPGQQGWQRVLQGRSLNNATIVSAFAATANVILSTGWANRIS